MWLLIPPCAVLLAILILLAQKLRPCRCVTETRQSSVATREDQNRSVSEHTRNSSVSSTPSTASTFRSQYTSLSAELGHGKEGVGAGSVTDSDISVINAEREVRSPLPVPPSKDPFAGGRHSDIQQELWCGRPVPPKTGTRLRHIGAVLLIAALLAINTFFALHFKPPKAEAYPCVSTTSSLPTSARLPVNGALIMGDLKIVYGRMLKLGTRTNAVFPTSSGDPDEDPGCPKGASPCLACLPSSHVSWCPLMGVYDESLFRLSLQYHRRPGGTCGLAKGAAR